MYRQGEMEQKGGTVKKRISATLIGLLLAAGLVTSGIDAVMVEIPAGSAAEVSYSYQPFDAYIGPTILQPVSISPDTWEVSIAPVVDNLGYQYYRDSSFTPMTKGQNYTLPTHKDDDTTDYLLIGANVEGSFTFICYCAMIGDGWAMYSPGVLNSSGQIVTRVISNSPTSTDFILGKIVNNIEISVNHDNTTTPEVQ